MRNIVGDMLHDSPAALRIERLWQVGSRLSSFWKWVELIDSTL